MKYIAIIIAAIFTLSACSGEASEPATQTVTQAAPETYGEPVEESMTDDEIVNEVFERAWKNQTEEDRYNLCNGMRLMPKEMLDVFMETYDEGGVAPVEITRDQVRTFFEGKCVDYQEESY